VGPSDEDADDVPSFLDQSFSAATISDKGTNCPTQGTGVLPAIGGVHPGQRHTNALLPLGERATWKSSTPEPHNLKLRTSRKSAQTDPRSWLGPSIRRTSPAVAKQLRENKVEFPALRRSESVRRPRPQTGKPSISVGVDDPMGSSRSLSNGAPDSVHPLQRRPRALTWRLFRNSRAEPDEPLDTEAHGIQTSLSSAAS